MAFGVTESVYFYIETGHIRPPNHNGAPLWGIRTFDHFQCIFFIYSWILTNLVSKWSWGSISDEFGLITAYWLKFTCLRACVPHPPNYLFCICPHARCFSPICNSEYIFKQWTFSQSFWAIICQSRFINKEKM